MDHRGLEELDRRQGRQEAGQPLGQHRLARARRSNEAQIVAPRCRDLEGPLAALLALDVTQVGNAGAVQHGSGNRRA